MLRRLTLALTATLIVAGGAAPSASAFIYWTNDVNGQIRRANNDGTQINDTFITGAGKPEGVAVDADHVYWANHETNTIGRASLDGSGVDQSFVTGADAPFGIAVDSGHVYWTNSGNDTIGRANLDGSGVDQSFITSDNADFPYGIAVDGRYLYWSNPGQQQDYTIARANLDGSNPNFDFIDTDPDYTEPFGLAVDANHVYWAHANGLTIGRSDVDGSNPDESFISVDQGNAVVAVTSQHVYWADPGNDSSRIARADLDGSNVDGGFIPNAGPRLSTGGIAVNNDGGVAAPTPDRLAFGTQPLGTVSAVQAVTITNGGGAVLRIGAISLSGDAVDDFWISSDTCSGKTLTPNAACTVRVRFAPGSAGDRRALLTLASNDPASPLEIPLDGTAGPLPVGPQGPAGPTGVTGATGARGAPGLDGVAGEAGAAGSTGPPGADGGAGPQGSQGPQGAQGPQGSPGRVRLVTCRRVKTVVGGRRVERRRCTSRVVGRSSTFTATGRARATLTRRGVLYATGTHVNGRLVLHARRQVRPGTYTLTLRGRHHGRPTIRRTPITITRAGDGAR